MKKFICITLGILLAAGLAIHAGHLVHKAKECQRERQFDQSIEEGLAESDRKIEQLTEVYERELRERAHVAVTLDELKHRQADLDLCLSTFVPLVNEAVSEVGVAEPTVKFLDATFTVDKAHRQVEKWIGEMELLEREIQGAESNVEKIDAFLSEVSAKIDTERRQKVEAKKEAVELRLANQKAEIDRRFAEYRKQYGLNLDEKSGLAKARGIVEQKERELKIQEKISEDINQDELLSASMTAQELREPMAATIDENKQSLAERYGYEGR